jgi:hypothetical protein
MTYYKIFELEVHGKDSSNNLPELTKLKEFKYAERYVFDSMNSAQGFIDNWGVYDVDYAVIPVINKANNLARESK